MARLTPARLRTYLIVLSLLFTLTIASLYFWRSNKNNREKLTSYFTVVSGVATAVTFISLWMELSSSAATSAEEQVKTREEQANAGFIEVYSLLMEYHPYSFRLWQQMSSNDPNVALVGEIPIDDIARRNRTEISVGNIIIQHVENIVGEMTPPGGTWMDIDFKLPANAEWVRIWRIWFRSVVLRTIWLNNKEMYDSSIVDFVDNQIIPHVYEPWPY
jgi:hypothetical protein